MLEIAVIEDPQELEALAPAWRALLTRAAHADAVQTPLWLTTWWRVFGGTGGRKLHVVVAHDGNVLAGLVPLLARTAVQARIVPFHRLELLATGEDEADETCSDYIGAIVERGRERDVAHALARHLRNQASAPWDELVMNSMAGESPFGAHLEAGLREVGVDVALEPCGACPYIALPATWEAYLAMLDRAQRYSVKSALRDVEAWAGPDGWALHRAASKSEIAEGKRVLVSLHEDLWRERGKQGAFASEKFSRFHDAVIDGLFEGTDGAVDLMWLTVKDVPIAAVYNIVYGGKVHVYQSGRKADVPKKIRPGVALHALAIKRAIDAKLTEYDFLDGTSLYKRQLATAMHPLVRLRAVAPSLRARTLERARKAAKDIATRLATRRAPRAA